MDYLKTEAPFWKKQHLPNQASGDWVDAKAQDFAAADKWRA
jgi:molybdopterin synthase catalytic subunit